MAPEIVPVVHIAEGRLVNPDGSGRQGQVLETARRLAKSHGRVYVVDMEGLRRNRPDVALLQEIGRRSAMWADGGARFATDAMDLLVAGADRVTMRWRLLARREALAEAAAVGEQVYVGIEFDEAGFVRNPDDSASVDDVLKLASAEQLGIVVIDRARAGTMSGIRKDPLHAVRSFGGDKWFAGGIASARDVGVLEDARFTGALVSTALLEGRFP